MFKEIKKFGRSFIVSGSFASRHFVFAVSRLKDLQPFERFTHTLDVHFGRFDDVVFRSINSRYGMTYQTYRKSRAISDINVRFIIEVANQEKHG